MGGIKELLLNKYILGCALTVVGYSVIVIVWAEVSISLHLGRRETEIYHVGRLEKIIDA